MTFDTPRSTGAERPQLGAGLADPTKAATLSKRKLRFEPGLEGLRGVAILGVLCFHSRFSWAVGGYLAIATFFTLSGYLITSLFLAEWQQTGNIRLGAFWARRFRRLMPASLLALAGMSIFASCLAQPGQLGRLRGEVLSALVYIANWHFIFTDAAYQHLFVAPSPVQHFWSLAIEEQFYFVFPLVALAGLRWGRGSRRLLVAVFASLGAASVLLSVWLMNTGATVDRVYYGSDCRAAEFLLGGLLALVRRERSPVGEAGQRFVAVVGVVAMAAILYLWSSVDLAQRWLYFGGFAVYSLLSVAVIAAAVEPNGALRTLLSAAPLRWIGRVSYGAYLFHWPIFLWLSAERTGLGPVPLFSLRLSATLTLSALSYYLVESPIRTRRVLTGWRAVALMPVATAAVAGAIALTTALPPRLDSGYDAGPDVQAVRDLLDSFAANPPDMDEAPGLGKAVPRITNFGDSTALPMGAGLGVWMMKEKTGRPRQGIAELGCGLAREGTYRTTGNEMQRPNHCVDRDSAWRELLETGRPDINVVMIGRWDICDRRLPGDDTWRQPGDPILDTYLQSEMLHAVDLLSSDGALVIWLTLPAIEARVDGMAPTVPFPESNPERMHRYNELISELEQLRPGKVRVLDLAGHMRTHPGGELDPAYRPDGTHLTLEAAVKLAYEWLGDEILRVYREESRRQNPNLRVENPGKAPPSTRALDDSDDRAAVVD